MDRRTRHIYTGRDYEQGWRHDDEEQGTFSNLIETIKENPLPAVLIGTGLGVLVAGVIGKTTGGTQALKEAIQERRTLTPEDTFVTWLKDAYAMEKGLGRALEHRTYDLQDHPHLRQRVEQHLEETRRHADRIRECIESRGSSVSMVKSGLGVVLGWAEGLSTEFARDEMVKNALVDYAWEQFEIASYKSLVTAAEELGDEHTAQVCREILHDEEEMAHWLEQQLPEITREYIGHRQLTSERRGAVAS